MLGGDLIIEVSAGSAVELGDTLRISAVGRPSGVMGLLAYDRLLDGKWSVSDPTVATITTLLPDAGDSTTTIEALLRGLRPGTVRVTMTARGRRGEASVRVLPIISEFVVLPARDTITAGDTVNVAVSAMDSRGAPIAGVPFAVEAPSGTWIVDGWALRFTPSTIRVVPSRPGVAVVGARFRAKSGQAEIVVRSR